ncbi:MAG: hypothetical protein JSV56_04230 [Methanomassiliicoccales archaeon]|nr:MAG: hypothetical protein JSV56_04230 [Methanomassiliicoccales archaeon]
MGVDLKKIYAKVAEKKQAEKRKVFVKVSNNGAVLGINGRIEKVEGAVKNLYANQKDIIDFSKLGATDLSKYHVILIGSHDKKVPLADRLKKYIEEGGFLVTTARCLDSFIADLFPDIITYEKQQIKGGAFKGEISSLEHPLFRGATKKKAMKFWIEDNCHPIKKVKPDIDEVVSSKKLEKKYGSGAMIVALNYGAGMIVHMLPKLHPPQSNEQGHYVSAYLLSNILDEAVNKAIPDEIRMPSDMRQMAYVNMVIIDDPSKNCAFCKSTFKEYEGKVFRCGSCGEHYHEFCIEQQLARDGTCRKCGKLMIYEKFKEAINSVYEPQYFQPPAPPPEPKKEEEKEEKKEEKKVEPPPPPPG